MDLVVEGVFILIISDDKIVSDRKVEYTFEGNTLRVYAKAPAWCEDGDTPGAEDRSMRVGMARDHLLTPSGIPRSFGHELEGEILDFPLTQKIKSITGSGRLMVKVEGRKFENQLTINLSGHTRVVCQCVGIIEEVNISLSDRSSVHSMVVNRATINVTGKSGVFGIFIADEATIDVSDLGWVSGSAYTTTHIVENSGRESGCSSHTNQCSRIDIWTRERAPPNRKKRKLYKK